MAGNSSAQASVEPIPDPSHEGQIVLVTRDALLGAGMAQLVADLMPGTSLTVEGTLPDAAEDWTADLYLVDEEALDDIDTGLGALIRRSGARVAVLSRRADAAAARDSFRAGAVGYLEKSRPLGEQAAVIRFLLDGGSYLPPQLLTAVLDAGGAGAAPTASGDTTVRAGVALGQSDSAAGLTPRQREVLALIAAGHSNKDIADRLGIGAGTVKLHVRAVLKELRARNRTDAARMAWRLGLTETPE